MTPSKFDIFNIQELLVVLLGLIHRMGLNNECTHAHYHAHTPDSLRELGISDNECGYLLVM